MKHIIVCKNFFKGYKLLRNEFEQNFKDAKSTHSKRFVWDFWYDREMYHLIRTPAYHYFSTRNYQDFHSHLVQWGREILGCHDISPPWLSYYVDGCYQRLHSDVPHGPWAFVYSLTPNKKKFSGGETVLLKPETLNYWNHFRQSADYEHKSFIDYIPSMMNRLTVFDPRFPHGVNEVKGTRDPLESRLVIHGWFVNPRPYVVGGLSTAQVQRGLEPAFKNINIALSGFGLIDGTVSMRLLVNTKGEVQDFKILTDTLISVENNQLETVKLKQELNRLFYFSKFPSARAASQITIPIIFK